MELRIASTWDGKLVEEGAVVSLEERDGLRVRMEAPFHGDRPPAAPTGALWGLWEHEVVELFVLGPEERYTELEIGPHGHHLLLRLHGVRNVVEREIPLQVEWTREGGRWSATAVMPPEVLPPKPWRVNAYAIHGVGEGRRYLAWAPVPGDKPDFHRLECFRPYAGSGPIQ